MISLNHIKYTILIINTIYSILYTPWIWEIKKVQKSLSIKWQPVTYGIILPDLGNLSVFERFPLIFETQPILQVVQILYFLLHEIDTLYQILLLIVWQIESLLTILQHLCRVLVVVDLSNHSSFIILLNTFYLLFQRTHVRCS